MKVSATSETRIPVAQSTLAPAGCQIPHKCVEQEISPGAGFVLNVIVSLPDVPFVVPVGFTYCATITLQDKRVPRLA